MTRAIRNSGGRWDWLLGRVLSIWGGHYVKYGSADMQVECDDGSIMKEGFGGCAFLNENGIEWHS